MSDSTIKITVNGFGEKVPDGSTISYLIEHLKEGDRHLLVEHNGKFIQPQHWETIAVDDGDTIEFIHACFGG